MKKYIPKDWQMNPDNIDVEQVQYWRNGVMLTGQMTSETAKQLVREKKAFVCTGQAISDINNP